jgi:hypothetical protein
MRKPEEVSTRQHVGAASTLNDTLSKLPPACDDLQKVSDMDMMDILASKAPKGHKELMTDHGFDPQTAATAEFVEICERAEINERCKLASRVTAQTMTPPMTRFNVL